MRILHKYNCSLMMKIFIRDAGFVQNTLIKRSMCAMHPQSKNKYLDIHPLTCLHDEPIQIKMKNLSPQSEVTLTSAIKDSRGQTFFTYTHYCADKSGNINLEADASLDGTYKGVFPMGPIAQLEAAPNEHKYLRFSKRDVTTPLQVNFKLLNGHLDANKSFAPDKNMVLDSVTHERIYMTPGTERISVRTGRLRATLFLPEGEGPFPGVVDMFGTGGGLVEFRSAQFAARGIASLALAYFDFEDLPKDIEFFDIGYFEEAVSFLLSNKKVKKNGVGAIGVSKGGDLACSMGAFIPEVKAVVCINGLPINTWCPLKTKEKLIPGLHFDYNKAKILSPELLCSYEMMANSEDFPETHLPLHETDAQFMFLIGTEDKNWKTELETMRAIERMKANGSSNYEVLRYQGAGHLIEPPYAPFAYATYHKFAGTALLWGGNAQEHTTAQTDSWDKMLTFLKRVLD